jgi:kynurenine 3-monooxygenase
MREVHTGGASGAAHSRTGAARSPTKRWMGMTTNAAPPHVLIVGAGPAGALMAILLGRRGYQVDVFERRADPRQLADTEIERRSINLGLSHRGITALTRVGVIDDVMRTSVRARGRVIHASDGRLTFQPYGSNEREILYSISRIALNRELIRRADEMDNVRFRFEMRCEELDRHAGTAVFRGPDDRRENVDSDFIVGADGAYSTVRLWMHRNERADFHQEYLDWGYKELLIPADADGRSRIELEALHIWPRGNALIVSHPNPNGSHTVTVFMPWEGERSFAALQTEAQVTRFFEEVFPDLPELVPDLAAEFLSHPTGSLVATRTAPWHHRDRCVLIGDGCHAVYPFYGQGMNAALEDCLVLDDELGRHPEDRAAAFRAYQRARKANTDALLELVKRNFDELRDTANQPSFVARKKVDLLLHRMFPDKWIPLYTMVVHSTMPYAEALERHKKQEALLRKLGVDAVLAVSLAAVVGARRLVSRRKRRVAAQVQAPLPNA